MEEQDVEHDEDLLLARGKLLDLEGCAVVHAYADLAGIGDGHRLVYEDLVDDVLEDDDGLGEDVVPADVRVHRACEFLVSGAVLGDLVAGRGELLPSRDVRLETRVPDEVELRLEVLAPELQLPVRHVLGGVLVRMLELAVLLGVAYRLRKLLGVHLQGGREMPVAALYRRPLRREVHGAAQLRHPVGADGGQHLALLDVDEQIALDVLDDEVGLVLEGYVEPLEGGLLQVGHIPAQGGVDHPHEGGLAHAVGRMDEGERDAEVQIVAVLVEQAGDADGLDEHDGTWMAPNGFIGNYRSSVL